MSTLLALFEMSGIVDTITSVIGTLLYPLFSIIFVLIKAIQEVFYAFAGIGSSSFDGTPIGSGTTGAENDQGILYFLLNNELVKNMLISIALLALFLVVIFTTMAFIKNVYSAKPKGWQEIVGNAIKGLANFVILPVCVLLGVWLGNVLLQAINGATSNGSSTSMERKLFIACAYNANLYRTGNETGRDMAVEVYKEAYGTDPTEKDVPNGLTDEEYADIVDRIYAETDMDIHAYWTVGRHYSLWQINYIVLIVGGIFMLYVLGSLAFAMVKRLFYILVLFIISPGVCALYPLDEGSAVKSWSGEVKKQVLSAYGAVAGLNIFLSLVPLVDKISIFESGVFGINDIVQIFILVTGLLVVKDLIGLISGFVGGDNAYSTGSSLMKQSKDAVVKNAGKAVRWGGVFARPIAGTAKGLWNIGKTGAGEVSNHVKHSMDVRREKKRRETQQEKYGHLSREDRQARISELSRRNADRQNVGEYSGSVLTSDEAIEKAKGVGIKLTKAEKKQLQNSKEPGFWTQSGRKIVEKTKMFGEGIKNSETGKVIGEEAKNAWDGTKALLKTVYDRSGAKGTVEKVTGEYDASVKMYDKYLKAEKEGKFGEHKVFGDLKKAVRAADKDSLNLATETINAMGDKFGDVFAKLLTGGKLGDGGAFAQTMGLNSKSTKADIANVDKILDRIYNYRDLINNSTGQAREEYIKSAIKFTTDTDANGNIQVQKALSDALNEFASDAVKTGGIVELNSETIKEMTKASSDAFNSAVKEFERNIDKLVKEVAKKEEKK